MRTLSLGELETLLQDAQVIEEDGYGLKVAHLVGGDFLKLYRRKRLLSSALWSAPAQRFADNARRLNQLGIPAPTIVETVLIPDRSLNGVRYQPLPGETLRGRWRALDENSRSSEIKRFGAFLGQLHQLGVYFRSLHLGNVLYLPDDSFGLIDLSDMKIAGRPLARWKRRRNLQHMLRYAEDITWLARLHRSALLSGYYLSCGSQAARQLAKDLERLYPS
ncbi:lipopolysaccharide kinase InaA family protein [Pseudomonas sp. LS44]|uniref:lipopolysaccharide kinase InaA family protein n=1 Tax=Pseudomonas sp. LS44 TaxID=1357074 RepID=UPI00215B462A|nr:lipopolysaccharide kinase InaA family protein [Pseudomonas sp. LS44]UVE18319.1 lipopolysaccharide kinase InaA family protein [Pseudomonas sp. LS44]